MASPKNESPAQIFTDKKLSSNYELNTPESPRSTQAEQGSYYQQSHTPFKTQPDQRPNQTDTTATSPPLTQKNLAEHARQQSRLWAGVEYSASVRRQESDKIIAAAQSLGIALPEPLFRAMTQNTHGMAPMERFHNAGDTSRPVKSLSKQANTDS